MSDSIKGILGWIAAAILIGTLIFNLGASHERAKYAKLQVKANDVVVVKNDKMQDTADKQEKVQIEYRDRIVIKYKTIKEEVTKYETTKVASDVLDGEFVRLHNAASTNGEVQATGTSSGTDEAGAGLEVTKGQAIGVIAENYEQYYQCARVVQGWQDYYKKLQDTVSE